MEVKTNTDEPGFGKDFPFLADDNVGDLLILCQIAEDQYEAYVLSSDEDIEAFPDTFGMSPIRTNAVINKDNITNQVIIVTQVIQSSGHRRWVFRPEHDAIHYICRKRNTEVDAACCMVCHDAMALAETVQKPLCVECGNVGYSAVN